MATGRVDKGMTRYLAHPLICRQPMQPDLFILIPLFAFIAFVYSSVGLGGGSSYTAVLTIVGMSYMLIPTISLTLNIVVTTGATFQFLRNGHLRWRVLLPLLMASVPAAWIGGRLQLPETTFQLLLLLTLIAVAVRIYLWKDPVFDLPSSTAFRLAASLVIGAVLGFVAGAVGIGGGIYLVPVLIMTGVATTREAAATGAAFHPLQFGYWGPGTCLVDGCAVEGADSAGGDGSLGWIGRLTLRIVPVALPDDPTRARRGHPGGHRPAYPAFVDRIRLGWAPGKVCYGLVRTA